QKQVHDLLRAGDEGCDPPATDEEGDGSLGMMEGYAAQIRFDGSQPQRTPIRSDCNAEAAMVLALCAVREGEAPAEPRSPDVPGSAGASPSQSRSRTVA